MGIFTGERNQSGINFLGNRKTLLKKILYATKLVLKQAVQLVASKLPAKVAPCDMPLLSDDKL